MGGMPAVWVARWCRVTLCRGVPLRAKEGKYFVTGSLKEHFPSTASIHSASVAVDLLMEAMPITVCSFTARPVLSATP